MKILLLLIFIICVRINNIVIKKLMEVKRNTRTKLLQKLQQFEIQEANDNHSQEREHFKSYFTYLLSIVGFAVGFGSFWRFPYLVYKNGGGIFLIPYLLAMLFLGVPLLYLQTAIGQMHQQSIPKIYEKINKGLKGFGYFVIILVFNVSCFYNTLLTYAYRYMFTAFIDPLPFANQSAIQNTYFSNQIIHKSNSINEFGIIHPQLACLFILSLYICYQVIKRGLQFSGKVLIFTVILPYIFLLILLIRGLFLSGAYVGVTYLFHPEWSKLFSFQIWIDAVVQVFFQMSIASAGLITYASSKPKKQSFLSVIYIIPISILICGLMSGLIIFTYIGHFCHQSGMDIHQLKLSGVELAFNVLPKTISILPWPNFLLFIFCVVLILLGIDTEMAFLESIIRTFHQQFHDRDLIICKITIPKQNIKAYVILLVMLAFPFFTCSAGIYYLVYFDSFITEMGLPFGALLELYIFVYVFKFQKLQEEVYIHTGIKTPAFIKWALQGKAIIIILSGVLVIGGFKQLLLYKQYTFWKYIFGWILTLYPIIIGVIYWKQNKTDQFNFEFKPLKRTEHIF